MNFRKRVSVGLIAISIAPVVTWAARGRGGSGFGGMRGGFGGMSQWMQQAQQAKKEEQDKQKKADAEKKQKEKVAQLLAEGWANLKAGDTNAALETFFDVLELKPDEAEARLGLGLSRASNGEWTTGQKQLELAMKTEAQRRLGTYNLAVLFARQNQKPRAAVTLHAYLMANAKKVDEMVLNAQRSLLFAQLDENARKGIGLLPLMLKALNEQDKTLAAVYPNAERFGMAWLPSGIGSELRKAKQAEIWAMELPFVLPDGSALKTKKPVSAVTENVLLPEVVAAQAQQELAAANISASPVGPAVASTTIGDSKPGASGTPGGPAIASADMGPNVKPVTGTGTGRVEKPVLAKPGDPEPPAAPVAQSGPPVLASPTPAAAEPAASLVTVRGAAFCVSPGIFVTCGRLVQGANSIKVTGDNGDPIDAEIVTLDEATGLAILKSDNVTAFKALPLGEKLKSGPAFIACYAKASVFNPELDVLKADVIASAKSTLRISTHPRSAGAPVMDDKGHVIALFSATREDPTSALPIIPVEVIRQLIGNKYPLASTPIDPDDGVVEVTSQRKQ